MINSSENLITLAEAAWHFMRIGDGEQLAAILAPFCAKGRRVCVRNVQVKQRAAATRALRGWVPPAIQQGPTLPVQRADLENWLHVLRMPQAKVSTARRAAIVFQLENLLRQSLTI